MKRTTLVVLAVTAVFLRPSLHAQGWQPVGPDSAGWQNVSRVSGQWSSPSSFWLAAVVGRGICLRHPSSAWSYDFINRDPRPYLPATDYYYAEFSAWSMDTLFIGYSETEFEPDYHLMRFSTLGGLWERVNWLGCWTTPFGVVHSRSSSSVFASACGFFRSTDGGISWTTIDSNGAFYWNKVLAIDNSSDRILYSAGGNGQSPHPHSLFRSTNQGATWDSIFAVQVATTYYDYPQSVWAQGDSIFLGIKSRTSDTSRAVGMYRSTDGGTAWNKVYNGGRVVGIIRSNTSSNTLFAASEEGILKSTDFGATWTFYNNALPTRRLTSVIISPYSDTMFASTETHGVLKVWNYLTDAKETSEQPTRFTLEQNYPNPFNPATCIPFSVGGWGFVNLKVYDLLGREVVTLVNEVRRPGTYSVNFDGSQLSSGVYYYRLTAGPFTATRKAILER